MAREDLHFRLRIPEDLKNKIAEAAALNDCSMTAEIIERLEQSFSRWPELDLPPAQIEKVMRLPIGTVQTLEWEIQNEAQRLVQKQIAEHENSRHALMRQLQQFIDSEPEEDRPKLIEQMRRMLAGAGLGSLDGDDDDIVDAWDDE